MERRLTSYIWKHTKFQQLWILFIVALSMVPYFMSFDLPKQIVNGPIQGSGFDTPDAVKLFMKLEVSLPLFGKVVLFPGIELGRMPTLFALSMVFLLFVVINGLFKYYINTYKGRLGERLLRRIRFELVDRVLRFPPDVFKRVKGSEIANMVNNEVEPMGGFTGDAFVSPALLGGQALTALVFIFVQSFWLGLITTALVSVQALIIPRMRRRLLVLGRERQLTARELAGRVGEMVEGIDAIHAFDTSNYERADVAARLGRIFKIRYDIYQWKFMVKFINNSLASFTPFLFYIVGGYLALKGKVDIGQLVAVIAAYKDLPGPLKDLIDWDQNRQDVQIKYAQVVGQFSVDGMVDPAIQAVGEGAALKPPLAAVNLTLSDDSGARLLDRINVQVRPGERVALTGDAAGGEALAAAFARLSWPDAGKVVAGGEDIHSLPESITGRAISYASTDVHFFSGSLRDNLFYGLKHRPMGPPSAEDPGMAWRLREAQLSGNPVHDIKADWIDYAAAGATGPEDLIRAVAPVLDAVQLSRDILDLALRATADAARRPGIADSVIAMRRAFRATLEERGQTSLIDHFEPGAYNDQSTVGENLLFGNAIGPALMPGALGRNPYFRQVLERDGLDRALYEMGFEIAENAIELFGDLPADHPFFQQLTFMGAEDLPAYQALVKRLNGKDYAEVPAEDRPTIIRLSFAYAEPRHRFGLLTDEMKERIVRARQQFHAGLPASLQGQIEAYDPARYMPSASLMDNVVFGRVNNRHADGAERVQEIVRGLMDRLGLYDDFLSIGLDFEVGTGGKRLTLAQRQKASLARALLRRTGYQVMNRPLTAVDPRVRAQIVENVLTLLSGQEPAPALIWVMTDSALASRFDRILTFAGPLVASDGRGGGGAAGTGEPAGDGVDASVAQVESRAGTQAGAKTGA
ncbi:MAG: ABC transporter ATP-binding protein [Proteobacteria bacterium]|nr:ABC transporter ATP-binding protein [Pseudomonadota bacterium]MBS0572102.1 ABC transporter ATP-binding protein [Pseudomonadota bacterium]